MTHSQSQLEPPTDSENFLKVFFTAVSLWWLLWLASSPNELQIYFESLRYGEIERTWLQKP